MRRLAKFWPRDRRRAQAGATLIEVLVSVVIMGFALVLVVGTFSSGLLEATLAKRNTAVEAVIQYELDNISGSPWASSPTSYSDCFATENPAAPSPAVNGSCDAGTYTLRADVVPSNGPSGSGTQLWTVTVTALPIGQVGGPVSVMKAKR
jgi:type II secretory pathway pseudopilin PulG